MRCIEAQSIHAALLMARCRISLLRRRQRLIQAAVESNKRKEQSRLLPFFPRSTSSEHALLLPFLYPNVYKHTLSTRAYAL
jgi:hypothetical protein